MQIGKNPFGQANFLDAFPLSFRGVACLLSKTYLQIRIFVR